MFFRYFWLVVLSLTVGNLLVISIYFIQLALLFSSLIYGSCYKAMESMARPTYTDAGALLDGGIDLNMTSGMAE